MTKIKSKFRVYIFKFLSFRKGYTFSLNGHVWLVATLLDNTIKNNLAWKKYKVSNKVWDVSNQGLKLF